MSPYLYGFQAVLSIFGLTGLLMAGRKKRGGWLLSLCSQGLWAAYLVITGQYLLLPGTLGYAIVYVINWALWGGAKRCCGANIGHYPSCPKREQPGA